MKSGLLKALLCIRNGLRHQNTIKRCTTCCYILFLIHFLNLCLLEKVLLLFLKSSDRFCVYGYRLYLWCSQRYLLDLTKHLSKVTGIQRLSLFFFSRQIGNQKLMTYQCVDYDHIALIQPYVFYSFYFIIPLEKEG